MLLNICLWIVSFRVSFGLLNYIVFLSKGIFRSMSRSRLSVMRHTSVKFCILLVMAQKFWKRGGGPAFQKKGEGIGWVGGWVGGEGGGGVAENSTGV